MYWFVSKELSTVELHVAMELELDMVGDRLEGYEVNSGMDSTLNCSLRTSSSGNNLHVREASGCSSVGNREGIQPLQLLPSP